MKKSIHYFSRFFMFYSKSWMMFYHILFKNHSCFINDFHKIFKIFQDFSGFFRIFQDFSCFIQDLEWYFITFYKENIHVLLMILMNFSRFFMIFMIYFWILLFFHHFTMICSCISPSYYNYFHIAPYLKVWTFHCCMHSLEIQCIQQWIQSIRQIVTCWTAYMRKRSKMTFFVKCFSKLSFFDKFWIPISNLQKSESGHQKLYHGENF